MMTHQLIARHLFSKNTKPLIQTKFEFFIKKKIFFLKVSTSIKRFFFLRVKVTISPYARVMIFGRRIINYKNNLITW